MVFLKKRIDKNQRYLSDSICVGYYRFFLLLLCKYVFKFFYVGVLDTIFFYGEDDFKYVDFLDVVSEEFVEGFGKSFDLSYVFGGHADKPIVGAVCEAAIFEDDVHVAHTIFEFACGDDIDCFVGDVLGGSFD